MPPAPDPQQALGPLIKTWGGIYISEDHVREANASGQPVSVYPQLYADAEIRPRQSKSNAAGARAWSGVDMVNGWPDLDSNRALSHREWFGSYGRPGMHEEIRRSDPLAQAICSGVTLPLLSLEWRFLPASRAPHHVNHAAFLNDTTSAMPDGGLLGLIRTCAASTYRGFIGLEPYLEWDPDYQLVVNNEVRMTGGAFLPRFQAFLPWAVERFERDGSVTIAPNRNNIDIQKIERITLAPWEYVLLRHDPEADNPAPSGILRGCYGPAKRRRNLWRLEAIGLDRAAMGIPVGKVQPGANVKELPIVRRILSELRTGARAHAVLPPGFELEIVKFDFKGKEIQAALDAAGREMLQAAHMQFLQGGIQGVGSYASSKGHIAFFAQGLRATGANIISTLAPVWPAVLRATFEDTDGRWPTLTHSPIVVEDDISKIAASVQQLVAAGALTIRPEDRQRLRAKIGLPLLDQEALDALDEEEKNARLLPAPAAPAADPEQ